MPLDVNEFANKIKAKYPEYKDVDNNLLAEKMIEKYPEYKGKVSFEPSKKKVATALPSEQPKVSSSSATQKTVEQKPSVSSGSEDNVFSGYPGKEAKKYKLQDGIWLEQEENISIDTNIGKNAGVKSAVAPLKKVSSWKPIENEGRVDALNKVFKQDAYYSKQAKIEQELKEKIIAQQKELKGKDYNPNINDLTKDATFINKTKELDKIKISDIVKLTCTSK